MAVLQSFNPATNELVGEVPVTPVEQIPDLVARARRAQADWATLEIAERVRILGGAADTCSRYR
jgi:acyl-CoA reductase-like NAD-dependent aldehyde dehydrogenase